MNEYIEVKIDKPIVPKVSLFANEKKKYAIYTCDCGQELDYGIECCTNCQKAIIWDNIVSLNSIIYQNIARGFNELERGRNE